MITPGQHQLGAPSSMVLDRGTLTELDLGSSQQGVVFDYRPAYHKMVVDQALPPIKPWRTAEEGSVQIHLVEIAVQKLLAAMSYAPGGLTTTATGSMASALAPTVVPGGTPGGATVVYQIVAFNSNGDAIPGPNGTIATSNAVISATNPNLLTWAPVVGAIGYGVLLQAAFGGRLAGLIKRVYGLSYTDTGAPTTPYTPSAANPVYPNSDTALIGGTIFVPLHTLDLVIPKNDGTPLNWRWSFFNVASGDQVQIDWKRDKNSEFPVKLELFGDPTRAVGSQIFSMTREY